MNLRWNVIFHEIGTTYKLCECVCTHTQCTPSAIILMHSSPLFTCTAPKSTNEIIGFEYSHFKCLPCIRNRTMVLKLNSMNDIRYIRTMFCTFKFLEDMKWIHKFDILKLVGGVSEVEMERDQNVVEMEKNLPHRIATGASWTGFSFNH